MRFRLVPKSVTLNDLDGVVALILRYFTFHRIRVRCRRKTIASISESMTIINTICTIIQRLFGENKL